MTGKKEDRGDKDRELPLSGDSLPSLLLQNIPACFLSKDQGGKFVYVNDEFAAVFGKGADEIIGKTVADFYPKEFAEASRMEDERLMRVGQVLEDVFEHTVDGETHYYASRKGPVRDEHGEVIGVQTIFWDVTKRQTAELELLAEREELRRTKQANDEAILAINEFLKTARQSYDDLPSPLRKALECLESQLGSGSK